MEKIKFIYLHKIYEIYVDKDDKFGNILYKYLSYININQNQVRFIYKGNILFMNAEKLRKIRELKNKNIIISVVNLQKQQINEKLKNIICPKCKNLIQMNIEENNILLDKCPYNHKYTYNNIKAFIENQKIKDDIKCKKCKNYLFNYNIILSLI